MGKEEEESSGSKVKTETLGVKWNAEEDEEIKELAKKYLERNNGFDLMSAFMDDDRKKPRNCAFRLVDLGVIDEWDIRLKAPALFKPGDSDSDSDSDSDDESYLKKLEHSDSDSDDDYLVNRVSPRKNL